MALTFIALLMMIAVLREVTAAQAPVNLRGTARFAVLAASEITSVPVAAIKGDVGLSPAARSKIAGLTAPEVTGSILAADDGGATAVLLTQAQNDLTTAYNDAAGRTLEAVDVANADLGGRTLAPGLYKSTGTLNITGNLTLDAQGDPNAVYIFQVASVLTAAPGSQVILSGETKAANVFWQVGTSAAMGTTSDFKGSIMADQSISFATGAKLEGRALVRIGAVTLESTTITVPAQGAIAPEFGLIARSAPNSVSMAITNTPGLLLTIQSSSDLINWITLGTRTFTASPETFIDNTASSEQKRFYRAY
ncbi:MAG TPA: ice-binding family protein, partial [Verrucomicrobiae bacterium]|nr:ice-binding family protein [Verrucomicrobiae bacterium]